MNRLFVNYSISSVYRTHICYTNDNKVENYPYIMKNITYTVIYSIDPKWLISIIHAQINHTESIAEFVIFFIIIMVWNNKYNPKYIDQTLSFFFFFTAPWYYMGYFITNSCIINILYYVYGLGPTGCQCTIL